MTIEPDDDAALELALAKITGNPSHDHYQQIMDKLRSEPREAVARFAVYCQQMDNLGLKPWEMPPCGIDDADAIIALGEGHADFKAAQLAKRMEKHGVSKYDPDPLAAVEAAKAKR
jgi:hypothetical protein